MSEQQPPPDPSSDDLNTRQLPLGGAGPEPPILGTVGKYSLLRKIGEGGMGLVYEGEDTVLQRRVAVKILPDVRAANFDSHRRFLREARAAARLHHANVVAIYDVDEHETRPYIVMELVLGGSVQDVLDAHGALPWNEAVRATMDACRGLIASHQAGLVHRDLKPSNLLCAPDGTYKLADFGLATGDDLATLTGSSENRVLGTPHYMSPEQTRSERVDALSDIYSLGATFYAFLTGQPPYAGQSAMQVMFAHCSSPVPDPRTINPTLPETCATILQTAMAKDRAKRYPDAQAFHHALAQTLGTSTPRPDELATPPDGQKTRVKRPVYPDATQQALPPLSTTDEPRPHRRRTWLLAVLGLVTLVSLAIVLFLPHDKGTLAKLTKEKDKPLPPVVLEPFVWDLNRTVGSLALTADGSLLAASTTGEPTEIRVWRLPNAKPILIREEPRRIGSASFSPRGNHLAYATAEREICIVDLASKESYRFKAAQGSVWTIEMSPHGSLLAVGIQHWGNPPGIAQVWDWKTKKLVSELTGLGGIPGGFSFSPDGKRLAFAQTDGHVVLWDWKTNEAKSIRAGFARPQCAVFSPDSRRVAVGGGTFSHPLKRGTGEKDDLGALTIVEVDTLEKKTWTNEAGPFYGLAFTADNQQLLAAGEKGIVTVWDVATRELLDDTHRHRWGQIRDLVFSADDRVLVTAGYDGTVRLWDVAKILK